MAELLDTLVSYVPRLILRRVEDDPTPITAPTSERFCASALFADVSGFTALTERLAQHGPAGMEELTRILNAYFGQMVAIINSHGGDVVKFAGDSLLALWPAGDEPEATAALRSTQCALALQQRLSNYAPSEGERLFLKVGVGAGEVTMVHLGGVFGRWEFIVAGEALAQAGVAAGAAQASDVIVSPETWALIGTQADGLALTSGVTRLAGLRNRLPLPAVLPVGLTSDAEAALRRYLPQAILSRLDAGFETGWLAELRQLSILFVNLPDFDHSTPTEQAQEVVRALQTALYRYEGSVNKITVDDKGVMMIAALGMPPLAHEDDPVRAVLAAMAMQRALSELGVRSSIGVTTGRAFCGSMGSADRREYTVMGAVVNLAARLMQAAGKEAANHGEGQNGLFTALLCDEATYLAARSQIEFDLLNPIRVKGKNEPVPIFRPRGQRQAAQSSEPQLIGREAEQAMLAEQLQQLRSGVSGVAIIEGDAGVGKSRLTTTLVEQAGTMGVLALAGGGNAIAQAMPYYAWRTIISELFDLDRMSDDPARHAHVLAELQTSPDLLRLAPLLSSVLSLEIPDNEWTEQLSGQVRADNTRDLLLRLMQQHARQKPTLIVLKDAHWLDASSLGLALLVSQMVQPLLMVITTRPTGESLTTEYLHLFYASGARQIRLDALTRRETASLIEQRLNVQALPDEVVALIYERAQGNPLFTEQLTYALRDTGVLRDEGGVCLVAPGVGDLRALQLPESVQSTIVSRIDRLAPAHQLVLKVASVIGRTFTYQALAAVYPVESERPQLGGYLAALADMGMITRLDQEPEPTFRFHQNITRDVTYDLMLFAQRRQLHQAVAEWYERTYADDLDNHYALLAHHWAQAGQSERVLDYAERAAARAVRSGAYREAIGFLRQALALEKKPGAGQDRQAALVRRARWERQLGEAHFGLGQIIESQRHLTRALEILNMQTPATPRGQMVAMVRFLGQIWKSRRYRLAPPEGTHERRALIEAVRADQRLARIGYLANRTLLSCFWTVRGLLNAERIGPSPELVRSYAHACLVIGSLPLKIAPLAEWYAAQARQVSQELDHLPSQAYMLMVTGLYRTILAHWPQADNSLNSAAAILEDLGDRGREWGDCLTARGFSAYFQNDFNRGVQCYADLYTTGLTTGNVEHQAWGLNGLAMNALRLGQISEALTMLETAWPLLHQIEDSLVADILHHGLMAVARMRAGEFDAARRAADRASEMVAAQRFPIAAMVYDGYAGPTEVYLGLLEQAGRTTPRERDDLRDAARRACLRMHTLALMYRIGKPRAWVFQGLYEWLNDRPERAYRCWRRAIQLAGQLVIPYDQGLAHYEIGRHSSGPSRRTNLERALALFRSLGASYDVERTEQLL